MSRLQRMVRRWYSVARRRTIGVVGLLVAIARAAEAQAGLTTAVRVVTMNATKPSTLSVNVVSGGTQSIAGIIDNAVNTFATPVRVTAAWKLAPALTSEVRMVAYFNTPAQALASGTNYITTARVKGRVLTTPVTTWQPTAWTAFTQNSSRGVGVNGGTLRLFRIPITGANASAARTFDLELQLDMIGQPALTPGTYSGTITVRAFTT